MSKKISVIIPVYNVKQYLKQCFDSVVCQSYSDLEIILVDDGSTDGSDAVCDELALTDDRALVVHKENGGLSSARNYGLKYASGEYIFFMDSDDAIHRKLLENLLEEYENGADIVLTGVNPFVVDERIPIIKEEDFSVEHISNVEAIRRMLLTEGISHMACTKLYKAELWQQHKFTEGILYEDLAAIYYIFFDVHKVSILKPDMYFYRIRQDSIMNKRTFTERHLALIDLASGVFSDVRARYPELEKESKRLEMVSYLDVLKRIRDDNSSSYVDKQKEIRDRVLSLSKDCWPVLNKNDKVKVIFLRIGLRAFHCLCKINGKW